MGFFVESTPGSVAANSTKKIENFKNYPGKRPQTVWSVYHTQSSQKVVAGGGEAPASTKEEKVEMHGSRKSSTREHEVEGEV